MAVGRRRRQRTLSRPKYYHVENFGGGLNTRDEPHLIKDGQCTEGTNCVFDSVGSVLSRKGYVIHAGTQMYEEKVHSLYQYYMKDSTSTTLAVCGKKLYIPFLVPQRRHFDGNDVETEKKRLELINNKAHINCNDTVNTNLCNKEGIMAKTAVIQTV